jgi:chromosome segregation ATPase
MTRHEKILLPSELDTIRESCDSAQRAANEVKSNVDELQEELEGLHSSDEAKSVVETAKSSSESAQQEASEAKANVEAPREQIETLQNLCEGF